MEVQIPLCFAFIVCELSYTFFWNVVQAQTAFEIHVTTPVVAPVHAASRLLPT